MPLPADEFPHEFHDGRCAHCQATEVAVESLGVHPACPGQLYAELVKARATPTRRPLAPRRPGYNLKLRIGGQKLYLKTGEYPDGQLGEVFVTAYKEGATVQGLLACLFIAVSLGLQYGVPLEKYARRFRWTRFEPAGDVEHHESITRATSILDLVFRELAIRYLGEDPGEGPQEDDLLPDALGRG